MGAQSALSASSTSSQTLQIPISRAFLPFLTPSRYKAAYGGRGSGKTHYFAGRSVDLSYAKPTRIVCIREVQNTLRDSIKQLVEDKISGFGLAPFFKSTEREIRGTNGSLMIFRGMQDYNAQSIKSLEGFDIALIVEAQALSQRSLDLLRPTIRKPGSEIWAEWNPESEFDPIDNFFRGPHPPEDAIIRRVNWSDNPWFPAELHADMTHDRRADAAKAAHIWDGEYQQAPKGAYYSELLANALTDGRITKLNHNPALEVHVSFDLGVGQNQSLWFSQWVGREVRVIDYLEGDEEAANEGYSWYARKMREKPYNYGNVYFPHDGRVREATGKSRAETMEGFNFTVRVLPMLPVEDGIDSVKRLLPVCYFDATKCAKGLTALKNYRENWDDKLRRSNGPLKDWTNHAADSFRYTAVAYDDPTPSKTPSGANQHHGAGGWMA